MPTQTSGDTASAVFFDLKQPSDSASLHQVFYTPDSARRYVPAHERLPRRMRVVFNHMAAGRSARETAEITGRALKTIEQQRLSVMTRLGLANMFEMGVYASRHGLTQGMKVGI